MKNFKPLLLIFVFAFFLTNYTFSQVDWNTGGNTISGAEYFGADASSIVPVSYEHNANSAISQFRWSTTNGSLLERMRLTQLGFLGLNTTAPATLFHMNNGAFLATGTTGANPNLGAGTRMMWIPSLGAFRAGTVTGTEWDNPDVGQESIAMGLDVEASGDNSVCLGESSDVSGDSSVSIGQLNSVPGPSSMAIGQQIDLDNFSNYGIGRRIHNTANNTITIGIGVGAPPQALANSVANTIMMGMNSNIPTMTISGSAGGGTFGAVGLGNITAPTHLLDVNGEVRVRNMANNSPDVLITGVQEDAVGDYELNHLAFTGNSNDVLAGDGTFVNVSSLGCEWDETGNDLSMGYTGACHEGNVGIGFANPNAKLHVANNLASTGITQIIRSQVSTPSDNIGHIGLRATTTGGRTYNVAIEGIARANFAASDATGHEPLIGVRGIAQHLGSDSCGYTSIGIYGEVINGSVTCGGSYAGYFAGDVVEMFPPIILSDAEIKENVNDIDGALEALMQLNPKSYNIRGDAFESSDNLRLNLGFIAQEVEEVFPSIVQEVPAPFRTDEEGNFLPNETMYKGIRYTELIPVLVSSIQEQQSQLDAQQAQLDALSSEIAACCASGMDARSGEVQDDIRMESLPSKHSLEQNAPNPFTTNTTLRFTMGNQAHARVCIYNSNGQIIDCLVDETKAEGQHRIDWDTSDIAPGIYFYSLEVDGFEQVRRAVKL